MSASRSDLIAAVAREAELTTHDATKAIDAALSAIRDLATGDKLILRGFGTFAVKERAARTGRNPGTGLPVEIAASTALTFKPAKTKA